MLFEIMSQVVRGNVDDDLKKLVSQVQCRAYLEPRTDRWVMPDWMLNGWRRPTVTPSSSSSSMPLLVVKASVSTSRTVVLATRTDVRMSARNEELRTTPTSLFRILRWFSGGNTLQGSSSIFTRSSVICTYSK